MVESNCIFYYYYYNLILLIISSSHTPAAIQGKMRIFQYVFSIVSQKFINVSMHAEGLQN